jgi:hypothetical protein
MEKQARMIEKHDHHGEAANHVDRFDPVVPGKRCLDPHERRSKSSRPDMSPEMRKRRKPENIPVRLSPGSGTETHASRFFRHSQFMNGTPSCQGDGQRRGSKNEGRRPCLIEGLQDDGFVSPVTQ